MAKHGSDDVAFFLVDGFSILGVLSTIEDSAEEMTEDTTALGDSWTKHETVGMRSYELSQEGWYDDAVGSQHDSMVAGNGVPRVITTGYAGNAIGAPIVAFAGPIQTKYVRSAARAELHKANAEYTGSGQRDEGVIVQPLATVTADGNTEADAVDNGALSTTGGAGYLQVTALDLDGYTNLAVKVRDSQDDITYVDLVTFAAVTAAPDAERITVTGTVDRYLAADWEFTGTGTSPSATLMVAFARQ